MTEARAGTLSETDVRIFFGQIRLTAGKFIYSDVEKFRALTVAGLFQR